MTTQSPFPGMDPYLEQHWRDVHQRLVTYSCDRLQSQLPSNLYACLEERVYLTTGFETGRSMYPDVRVTETDLHTGIATAVAGTVAEATFVEDDESEPVTEGFVEVRDAASGDRVITVIEILSPTNKHDGPGQDLYRQKQQELRSGGVSLVEIDLLLGGKHTLSIPWERVPVALRTPYLVCMRRSWRPIRCELYHAPLRKRLPVLPIPLRQTDADAKLDLQAILDQAYTNGRYRGRLDYGRDLDVPVHPADVAWMDELLRSKGCR